MELNVAGKARRYSFGVCGIGVALALGACGSGSADASVAQVTESALMSAETDSFSVTAPVNVNLLDLALASTDRLTLEDGSSVLSGVVGATISNMGSGGTVLEHGARSGTIYSASRLVLEPGVHVEGGVSATAEQKEPGARVDGKEVVPAVLTPADSFSVSVTFPKANSGNVSVSYGRRESLPPSRYANTRVDGRLVLSSGIYYFETLQVFGSLEVTPKSGPVTIYVKHGLLLNSTLDATDGAPVAFVDLSDSFVFLPHSFSGALIAPNASLVLGEDVPRSTPKPPNGLWARFWGGDSDHNDDHHGSDEKHGAGYNSGHDGPGRYDSDHHGSPGEPGATFSGAFFAKSIHVGAGVTVKYVAPNFLAPLLINPDDDLGACAKMIRPDPTLSGDAQARAYQTAIAQFCSMPGASACEIDLVSRANIDYTQAALKLVANSITPAQYLAIVRDRSRKRIAAEENPATANALCEGKDSDGDLIPDSKDRCPRTPALTPTTDDGCTDNTLPKAPSAADMQTFFQNSGLIMNLACRTQAVVPRIPAGAFYFPSDRSKGTFILSGRVDNQDPGCPVWYLFDIEETNPTDKTKKTFSVAFKDSDESTALIGSPNPVPESFIQFNPLPTDAGARGQLGSAGGTQLRFRVQAMNGAGIASGWSEWKQTTAADCTPLGFSCN